jgi:hypothetical protein
MRLTLGRSFEANALYLYAEDRSSGLTWFRRSSASACKNHDRSRLSPPCTTDCSCCQANYLASRNVRVPRLRGSSLLRGLAADIFKKVIPIESSRTLKSVFSRQIQVVEFQLLAYSSRLL